MYSPVTHTHTHTEFLNLLNSGHNLLREIDAPSLVIMTRQFMSALSVSYIDLFYPEGSSELWQCCYQRKTLVGTPEADASQSECP